LVRRTEKPIGLWRLFEPFTPGLWAAIAGSTFVFALLIVVVNGLTDGREGMGVTPDRTAKAIYHSWAALLGGEDYEWVSWPGRMLRLGLLFMVLLVGSTYTANLASFFTNPSFRIHGPVDRVSLLDATACILDEAVAAIAAPFVKSVIAPNETLEHSARRQWCHDALQTGLAAVWMDDYASTNEWLLSHCSSVALVPTIQLAPRRLGFMTTRAKSGLAANISAALADLEKKPAFKDIHRESFGWGASCGVSNTPTGDTAQVSFESMAGLFVICGTIAAISLGMSIMLGATRRIRGAHGGAYDEDFQADHTATEGEMLRALLQKVDKLEKHEKLLQRSGTNASVHRQHSAESIERPGKVND